MIHSQDVWDMEEQMSELRRLLWAIDKKITKQGDVDRLDFNEMCREHLSFDWRDIYKDQEPKSL